MFVATKGVAKCLIRACDTSNNLTILACAHVYKDIKYFFVMQF